MWLTTLELKALLKRTTGRPKSTQATQSQVITFTSAFTGQARATGTSEDGPTKFFVLSQSKVKMHPPRNAFLHSRSLI